jgi:hypothetical protein
MKVPLRFIIASKWEFISAVRPWWMAVVDFFAYCYGPFTKKGDTMMFYDGNGTLE